MTDCNMFSITVLLEFLDKILKKYRLIINHQLDGKLSIILVGVFLDFSLQTKVVFSYAHFNIQYSKLQINSDLSLHLFMKNVCL